MCYPLWVIPYFNSFLHHLNVTSIEVQFECFFTWWILVSSSTLLKMSTLLCFQPEDKYSMVSISQLVFVICDDQFNHLSVILTLFDFFLGTCFCIMSYFTTTVTGYLAKIPALSKINFCPFSFKSIFFPNVAFLVFAKVFRMFIVSSTDFG